MFECFKKKQEPKVAPWFDLATQEIGTKEIKGSKDNPRIVEYHQATTLKATDDETAWCSSFVCWCLETSGIKSTRSAAARSFLKWGKEVGLSDARKGDVVVFKRGNSSWQGHVAFFIAYGVDYVEVLGGNQSNEVNISRYKMKDLLSVRRAV
jgi:uncharacterized protein (TIGR02594 family)